MIHCNKQCWGSGISRAASLLARTWPGCLDHLPTSDASFPLWWETFPRRLLNLHTKRLLLAILQTCLDRLTPSDSRLSGWVSFYHLSNSPLSSSIHSPGRKAEQGEPWVVDKVSKSGSHCLAVWPGITSSPSLVPRILTQKWGFWTRLAVPTLPCVFESPGEAFTKCRCRGSTQRFTLNRSGHQHLFNPH